MANRVNFIEKGASLLTYKKMVIYGVIWFVFCLGIFVVEKGYVWWLDKRVTTEKSVLTKLNARKERTMALLEASKTKQTGPDVKELSHVYSSFPNWSKVLSTLADNMPTQVWLTSVKAQFLSQDSLYRRLEIAGVGKNNTSIARFVKRLNSNPIFRNMVLHKSKKREDDKIGLGYDFTIVGEVRFKEKIWN